MPKRVLPEEIQVLQVQVLAQPHGRSIAMVTMSTGNDFPVARLDLDHSQQDAVEGLCRSWLQRKSVV